MSAIEIAIESSLAEVAAASEEVDCLVIGSGTAGVTTALVLAERGYRVVILEAGPLLLLGHIGNTQLNQYGVLVSKINTSVSFETRWLLRDKSEPEKNMRRGETNTAWSVVGGRSIFWSGCAPRFNEWDFEDWPLTYADMAYYYDQAEQLIQVSGNSGPDRPPFFQTAGQSQTIAQLCSAGFPARPAPLGVDTRVGRRLGAGFDSSISRLLGSDCFGSFGAHPAVSLVAQAIAIRLHVLSHRVSTVDVLDRRTKELFALKPRHVVLAGGALQSARLALRSGLDAVSPRVGHHISDHLFVQGVANFSAPRDDGGMSVFIDATPDRPFHFHIEGCFRKTWYHHTNPVTWVTCDADGVNVLLASFGAATADIGNRIVLDNPGDPASAGLGDFHVIYDRSPRDLETLGAMEQSLEQIASAIGTSLIRTQVNPPGRALHEIGGLRMSADPETGVTDPFGRFWRIGNLSVADASTFPSQGSANPYLTITAWSLRHAVALAEELGSRS